MRHTLIDSPPAEQSPITIHERIMGSIIGGCVGDALGTPLEWSPKKNLDESLDDFGVLEMSEGGGTMCCVMESLISCKGFYVEDVAERLLDWYLQAPEGVSPTTIYALELMAEGYEWHEASIKVLGNHPAMSGAGCLPRCVPLAALYHNQAEALQSASDACARITHQSVHSRRYAILYSQIISLALTGKQINIELFSPSYVRPRAFEYVASCINSLTFQSFKDAMEWGLSLGGNTGILGSCVGALSGARFGMRGVPKEWFFALRDRKRIEELALGVVELMMSNEDDGVDL